MTDSTRLATYRGEINVTTVDAETCAVRVVPLASLDVLKRRIAELEGIAFGGMVTGWKYPEGVE